MSSIGRNGAVSAFKVGNKSVAEQYNGFFPIPLPQQIKEKILSPTVYRKEWRLIYYLQPKLWLIYKPFLLRDISNEHTTLWYLKIRRLETLLEDSMATIDILERKNTEFSRQIESARNRIDELESSRRNFADSDVDESGVDELKSVQARKIVRLECTMAVLEAEVSHLSSTIADLEET